MGDTIRTIAFDPNTGIYGLDMANDGSVFCISTYNVIYIFNADGSRRDSISQYGQTVSKISGDGTYFVKGDFNSRACLYRWNGSNYDLVWQCFTGHPWVTAVGISDDGSTIMAGTYQYSPNNTGKVMLLFLQVIQEKNHGSDTDPTGSNFDMPSTSRNSKPTAKRACQAQIIPRLSERQRMSAFTNHFVQQFQSDGDTRLFD